VTGLDARARCPAVAAGDAAFVAFTRACAAAVAAGGDVQGAVAALTRPFVQGWRMPDPRYRALQPDSPYASYLLYLSPEEDLSIVLDIFMTGQAAVVHNHCCWGLFACLEGAERETLYDVPADLSGPPVMRESRVNAIHEVRLADPASNAFHQVECAGAEVSTSLHIYGADIGRIRRQCWDAEQGAYRAFTGGYSNAVMGLPNYLAATSL